LTDEHRMPGCCDLSAASKSEAFEGISNVSRAARIAAGVASTINMRTINTFTGFFTRITW
jgi:hypothetical protein